jgi:hypothetical protein
VISDQSICLCSKGLDGYFDHWYLECNASDELGLDSSTNNGIMRH